MKEFVQLFRDVFDPERDWSKFVRKFIGVALTAGLTLTAYGIYHRNYYLPELGEESITTVLRGDPTKRENIKTLLYGIKTSSRDIKSVWLYSWPDARSVVPVMRVGIAEPPLPEGTFLLSDAETLGGYLFGHCGRLPRPFLNYTCPINGMEDSWGILIITYEPGTEGNDHSHVESVTGSIAHRIGLMLYTNPQHSSELSIFKTSK